MSGYAKVASLMAHHGEVATFQRFEFLNMLDLLYHQAELVHLEDELRASMKIDSDSGDAIPVGESRSTQTVNMERASVMSALERRKSTPEIEHKMSGEERELQMLDEKQGKRDDEMSEQSSSFSGSSGASERFEGTRDWWYLSHASHSHTWELMLKTRKKLKEYNEALLQQSQLAIQNSPNESDIHFLKRWFSDPRMGDFPLIGKDSSLYENSSRSALVAIQPRRGEDPLSSLFLRRIFIWYHRLVGRHFHFRSSSTKKSSSESNSNSNANPHEPTDEEAQDQYFSYSDKKILRAANVVGSVISSALLVGSIVALYFVKDMLVRLGVIAVFTQAFSLVLVLVTRARKVEVFAATAAFMAVQVVFVGTTDSRPLVAT